MADLGDRGGLGKRVARDERPTQRHEDPTLGGGDRRRMTGGGRR
jgi:hypothetical protein